MSDTDIDYIEHELQKTTVPGNKVAWPPPANSTHWHNAYERLEALRAPAPPPPPPPPPPPSAAGLWAKSSIGEPTLTNTQDLVKRLLAMGPWSWFTIEAAYGLITDDTAADIYNVSGAGAKGAMDDEIWLPKSLTKSGLSKDAHVVVEDRRAKFMRWHDFDGAVFTGGQLASWSFGKSMPIGSVNIGPRVPGKTNQGATAAGVPLAQGRVTLDDMAAGEISHALVITATNVGPGQKGPGVNPYPATDWGYGYTTGNVPAGSSVTGNPALGQRFRFPQSYNPPAAAAKLEKMIVQALKTYWLVISDRSTDVSFHGLDPGGGGASIPAWKSAGVPLSAGGTVKLANIDWSKLEAIGPLA